MEDKSLADKAINLKGKQYVLVSDRVLYFNETYEQGCIQTELESFEGGRFIVRARVFPEGMEGRCFTGYSQATMGGAGANKDAALENAETSAVGRALAFMGIGVIESIASADEVRKVSSYTAPVAAPNLVAKPVSADEVRRIEARKDRIINLVEMLGGPKGVDLSEMSAEARNAYKVDLISFITKQGITIPFTPANYEKIGEELAVLVEKNVDPIK